MDRLTERELSTIPFGSKVKVVWHESQLHCKGETYFGVVFGDKLGYEDGKVDEIKTITEGIINNWCNVYLMW